MDEFKKSVSSGKMRCYFCNEEIESKHRFLNDKYYVNGKYLCRDCYFDYHKLKTIDKSLERKHLIELERGIEDFLSDSGASFIHVDTEGKYMNSPHLEKRELHIKITYEIAQDVRTDFSKDLSSFKDDLKFLINEIDEIIKENQFNYEQYLKGFCKYCNVKDNQLLECLRHHTVSYDLKNVFNLLSNQWRTIEIGYYFAGMYPIYFQLLKSGWNIEAFKKFNDLYAEIQRPSGIKFRYNSLFGKSIYLIFSQIKSLLEFLYQQIEKPYPYVELEILLEVVKDILKTPDTPSNLVWIRKFVINKRDLDL